MTKLIDIFQFKEEVPRLRSQFKKVLLCSKGVYLLHGGNIFYIWLSQDYHTVAYFLLLLWALTATDSWIKDNFSLSFTFCNYRIAFVKRGSCHCLFVGKLIL